MSNGEIIIATFPFSGHIFPATELATQLASRNYRITLLLPSLPSSPLHPLIRTVQCSGAPPGPPPDHAGPPSFPPFHSNPHQGQPNGPSTKDTLAQLIDNRDASSPSLLCVIVDVMVSQLIQVCTQRGVPAASLFTASACVTALEHASINFKGRDIGPDGSFVVPGLPEEMALSAYNLSQVGPPMHMSVVEGPGYNFGTLPPMHMPPPPPPGHNFFGGPHARPPLIPGHGARPSRGAPPPPPAMGLGQTDDAIALLINT